MVPVSYLVGWICHGTGGTARVCGPFGRRRYFLAGRHLPCYESGSRLGSFSTSGAPMDLVRRNSQFPITHPSSPFSRSIVPSRTSDRIVFGGGRSEERRVGKECRS